MKLKVIGSGSAGNCYILETKDEALVIEAGVHLKHLKRAIDFNISKVSGVLISHIHGDHSKYAEAFSLARLKVYRDFDSTLTLGSFKVIPFELVHDVKTFGFLINHQEMGTTCYISDTHYVPLKMRGLNNMIIECNYDQEILDSKTANGSLPTFLRERIMNSHMSLETVKGVMKANDLTQVNNIVLIHLSDSNSHADKFRSEITQLTGKNVTIADSGLEMDFNKEF